MARSAALILALLVASPALAKRPDRAVFIPPDAGRRKILPVPQHYQSTEVWCWAASIAMANEFFYKKPINDCDVTSKVDLKAGGRGRCCQDKHCNRGAHTDELAEISDYYFHMHVTMVHRALTWDELTTEINAGRPFIMGLHVGRGMGHAVVVAGYAEPGYVFINDPWNGRLTARFESLTGSPQDPGPWRLTWELQPTDRMTFGIATMPAPMAQAPAGPPKSTVTVVLTTSMKAGPKRTAVEKAIAAKRDLLRACYEQGLTEQPAVAPVANALLSFAVDRGNPAWLRVKDSSGLTENTRKCLMDTVARWTGLYPADTNDDPQSLHIDFAVLHPPPPAVAGAGAGQPATLGADGERGHAAVVSP